MQFNRLKIKDMVLLAPMAGVTDQPFRTICKEMGADIVYTEFVSANGIIRENMKTLELMKFSSKERPIGIQLFGEDPEIVGSSSRMVYDMLKPDIIDINYGCPVPKVTKKGAGSAALKDLCLMKDITSAVIESVPNIPVTIKMRSGWDSDNIVSTKAGLEMERIGVSAITLHPRTTIQMYKGKSNWDLIKELKEAVNIPVIGNGDVSNYLDYKKMKELTKCDGVMIGRGALGNPWIFNQIKSSNMNTIVKSIDVKERMLLAKKHFKMLNIYYNENISVNLSKKHFSYYFKGFSGASSWRKKFMSANCYRDICTILSEMELGLNKFI